MKTIKLLLIFCCLFLPYTELIGQLEMHGIIRDYDSQENLINAHIYNLSQGNGTISNELGEFLIGFEKSDTLRFSYLGYNDLIIAAKDFPESGIIDLEIDAKMIDAITVIADDGYLYKYISDCRKKIKKDKSKLVSKAYMNIISYANDIPIEFIESFHNVEVKQSSLNSIKFKNGKSVLAPNHLGSYFFNLNISQALSRYSVLAGHYLFPTNPLELSKKKLRKRYQLTLENQTDQLIVISFEPRRDKSKFFKGKIWIDKFDNSLLAIELKSDDKDQKLFQGIGLSRIKNINYTLKFSFQKKNDNTVLSFIKLNYDAEVVSANSFEKENDSLKILDISSQSIIHLFDHNSTFILPFFETPEDISDYRLFTIPPQNDTIWEKLQKLNQIKLTKEEYVVKNDIQQRGKTFKDNVFLNEKFFEHNYTRWDKKGRVTIKKKKKKQNQNTEMVFTREGLINQPQNFSLDQLKLDIKLYLDINSSGKDLVYESSTILDVFNSYNYLDESVALNCYVNIYFDIGEVFRRKLVERIEKSDKSVKSIQTIYDKTIDEMDMKHNLLIKEAFAGRNIDQLEEWNRYILKELGLNNFELIGFDKDSDQIKQNVKHN